MNPAILVLLGLLGGIFLLSLGIFCFFLIQQMRRLNEEVCSLAGELEAIEHLNQTIREQRLALSSSIMSQGERICGLRDEMEKIRDAANHLTAVVWPITKFPVPELIEKLGLLQKTLSVFNAQMFRQEETSPPNSSAVYAYDEEEAARKEMADELRKQGYEVEDKGFKIPEKAVVGQA